MSQDAASAEGQLPRPGGRGRWTSFIADPDPDPDPDPDGEERAGRGLHEQSNPRHRLRVEHDNHTLLIHLSDEDGGGWTTIAIDRGSRRWTVAQDTRQTDTSPVAYDGLYKS